MSQFKPMLASRVDDLDALRYPKLASCKLDGIRAIVLDGQICTRNLKPIRNDYIRSLLSNPLLNGLDGELVVGPVNSPTIFCDTLSGVMSKEGEPDFTFWVFDSFINPNDTFSVRYASVKQLYDRLPIELSVFISVLDHSVAMDSNDVTIMEQAAIDKGFEGLMLRAPDGKYKFGRASKKEETLLKIKRFMDFEVVVTGFKEQLHNANAATIDNLGATERSSHKENMIPMGTLGALIATGCIPGTSEVLEFSVGTGFTDVLRQEIWDNKEKYLGKTITIKFFDYGGYVKARMPVFKGFREDI